MFVDEAVSWFDGVQELSGEDRIGGAEYAEGHVQAYFLI